MHYFIQGHIVWTHEAVLLPIERRRELGYMFDNNAITHRQAWRKVADELHAKGYKYCENDCSKKFRSLRSRFVRHLYFSSMVCMPISMQLKQGI